MFKKILLVAVPALLCVETALAANFLCVNKSAMNDKFWMNFNGNQAEISSGGMSCAMRPIEYNPISEKYKGWIRFAPEERGCSELGQHLFGEPSDNSLLGPLNLYWISVSVEMQRGKDGFAQMGFANLWDPGAGETSKVFVRCFAK